MNTTLVILLLREKYELHIALVCNFLHNFLVFYVPYVYIISSALRSVILNVWNVTPCRVADKH
jgi:hypothetical protein